MAPDLQTSPAKGVPSRPELIDGNGTVWYQQARNGSVNLILSREACMDSLGFLIRVLAVCRHGRWSFDLTKPSLSTPRRWGMVSMRILGFLLFSGRYC